MLAFACDNCGQLIFFENTACLSCGAALGVIPIDGVVAVQPAEPDDENSTLWQRWGDDDGPRYRFCANRERLVCNWLVPADDDWPFCGSCRLTRTQPPLDDPASGDELRVAETAKRRLLFQLDLLGLPIVGRGVDPDEGLAFDLLSSTTAGPVTTGHQDGVIAMDLAESDDVHREGVRQAMGEPYRTVLGHLRHEIGHYYWMVFARDPRRLARIRSRFGDDTVDYAAALDSHYGDGPPSGWEEFYVSAYATTHPWEDWAETFAHYLHIRASLQTAAAFGVIVAGPRLLADHAAPDALVSVPEGELDDEPFAEILDQWLPLTYALNELNRTMGKDPLYPFVLAPTVVNKLTLVHRLVREVARATVSSPAVPARRADR